MRSNAALYSTGMISTALVFLGAGIGGALRHGVNVASPRWLGMGFPYGTMAINILGSGLMGLVAGWFAFKAGATASQDLRLFLATGILGGFTTFSAFSLDAVLLWERGEAIPAVIYVVGSVVASLVALVGGLALVRGLT
ncbi:putative fluoride ion transporter CrcB [Hyphomicrobiales bacterium]|nr:putative fluoride ion transporter CrcB [Hyphomicrobiales bacterium]CAH1701160.1 Putative fluoride ion transporter CrcB [Hyphomicrobiales bacterium]CAI0345125.1 putative fluoride ion transporter CrcB [Hyphomicrobiales bacterium]